MSSLEAQVPAPSKRARSRKPFPLNPPGESSYDEDTGLVVNNRKPVALEPSSESSYDEEPAPVKRRKPTASSNPAASAKPAAANPTPDKTGKKSTEAAVTKAGKSVLETYNAGAEKLTAKQTAELVAYTEQLEDKAGGKKMGEKELRDEVHKLRGLIKRGIEKSLTWKPSCKTNGAKFSYEELCPNPAVMDAMLGKKVGKKRFTVEEFKEEIIKQGIMGSVRYADLYIVGNVNMKWDPQTGIYLFTGKYGKA